VRRTAFFVWLSGAAGKNVCAAQKWRISLEETGKWKKYPDKKAGKPGLSPCWEWAFPTEKGGEGAPRGLRKAVIFKIEKGEF
jgi:hypothetical protein